MTGYLLCFLSMLRSFNMCHGGGHQCQRCQQDQQTYLQVRNYCCSKHGDVCHLMVSIMDDPSHTLSDTLLVLQPSHLSPLSKQLFLLAMRLYMFLMLYILDIAVTVPLAVSIKSSLKQGTIKLSVCGTVFYKENCIRKIVVYSV